MNKFAIRLLTLAAFAMTSLAAPMVVPAKAATDGSTPAKKKHKKMNCDRRADARSRDFLPRYPRIWPTIRSRKVSY